MFSLVFNRLEKQFERKLALSLCYDACLDLKLQHPYAQWM
ncbi:hypothetical protein AA102526_1955 [Asaia lannensis NBRC 102526]|nr:hypothetical protein AA102526_1955 [Asaia lannensis NBRC 102526]